MKRLSLLTVLPCLLITIGLSQSPTQPPVSPVAPKPPAKHPLDPLGEDEYETLFKLLKEQKKTTRSTLFGYAGLKEPSKDVVLGFKAGDPIARRAGVVCYDVKSNTTIEGTVNLTDRKIESWEPVRGAQAAVEANDGQFTERLVRTDARWQEAIRKRGFDPLEVEVGAMPARGYIDRPLDGSRYTLAVSFFQDREEWAEIDGLIALVNVSKRRIEWIRDEQGASPRVSMEHDFEPDEIEKKREAPKPLRISQPDGHTFQIDGSEVRWQGWRFRIGHDPRSGLVLHTVGYEEAGKVRSVLYRGSLSELYVPYGDPSWVLMHWFDAGEIGLGYLSQSPLQPMNDVPENAKLLAAQTHTQEGKPKTIPNAIAIYEKDAGVLWRHGGDSRRARQLVVGCIYQVGNYDYGVNWVFHQDGVLEVQVELTGLMIPRNVERAKDPDSGHANGAGSVGTLVAPNIQAPNHQHFFSFRLDIDVDGPVKNALYEMNVEAVSAGKGNPHGNGFAMLETPLRTEKAAQRSVHPGSARSWKVVNSAVRNSLNQPAAYMLMPEGNAQPYALPGSYLRKVGAFAEHHLWATPYAPSELYAAGTYVRDGEPADGLVKWTAGNRSIEFEDIVLWYTVGVTHIPRPEDWPIMAVHRTGFKLMPAGFFSRNPALDVPETKPPKPTG